MTEDEINMHLWRRCFLTVLGITAIVTGGVTYCNHIAARASVEVQQLKNEEMRLQVEQIKAQRDRDFAAIYARFPKDVP